MDTHTRQRYFLELSFDGSNYHGWQIQPNAISVQQLIEQALSMLLREEIQLTGAGRTDTGVHAKSYTAHFDSHKSADELPATDLVYKLNCVLPSDIAVNRVYAVKHDAHARYSALARRYEYLISRSKDPFMVNRAWILERPLNFEAMQQAASLLLQYNDFECFSKSNTQVNNYRCTLMEAQWQKDGHLWIFTIKSNRFLRNMVRAIVGTLADVGLGKTSLQDLDVIIKSKNRSNAGYSVPGCGLYFMGADYHDDIYLPGN